MTLWILDKLSRIQIHITYITCIPCFRKLVRSLGEAGEIEPETEGMLIENGIDYDEFPQEVWA